MFLALTSLNCARRLKLLGAALLLLGLMLPLYSCRGRFVDSAGREIKYLDQAGTVVPEKSIDLRKPLPPGVIRLEPSSPVPPGMTYHKNYHFFFGDFSYNDLFDWFRLTGFLWPLVAALFAARLKRRWSRGLFRGLEPVLVLESALALSTSALFGAKEIGFWTAWTGIFLYSLGAASSDMTALADWKPALGKARRVIAGLLVYGVFLSGSVLSVIIFFKWLVK